MTDEDDSLRAKRVYADATGATTAFVGTAAGVVRVSVSDDIVGEFSLEYAAEVTDLAVADGSLAVGTPDDVFVRSGETFEATGFGPASAVGHDRSGRLIAAGAGRLARYETEWTTLAELDAVRAIGSDMVAAASGIHRHDGTHVGLDDARDVSTAGRPLAATAAGLYYLANGWMRALEGDVSVVASDGATRHAAAGATCYIGSDDGTWRETELPVAEPIADIAHGGGVYAVTTDGTVLANVGDGWRHRSLGVPDVTALAVEPPV